MRRPRRARRSTPASTAAVTRRRHTGSSASGRGAGPATRSASTGGTTISPAAPSTKANADTGVTVGRRPSSATENARSCRHSGSHSVDAMTNASPATSRAIHPVAAGAAATGTAVINSGTVQRYAADGISRWADAVATIHAGTVASQTDDGWRGACSTSGRREPITNSRCTTTSAERTSNVHSRSGCAYHGCSTSRDTRSRAVAATMATDRAR